jgi:hypothetical protein
MVAAGTGATVGITLWVVADGRYEPQNFPFFHVEDTDLVWDWPTQTSNYTTLRAQKEQALSGAGWEIESSIDLSQSQVQSYVLYGGVPFGGGGYAPAANDYVAVPADDAGAGGETADQVRQDDLTTLFTGIGQTNGQARVTRIRSDLSHAALSQDLQLQASQDQSALSNVHQAKQESGEPMCTIYNASCQPAGQVPRSQALNPPQSSTFACATPRTDVETTPLALGGAAVGLVGLVVAAKRRRRSR